MPTCNKCRCHFRTLEDEEQDHPCPRCGWHPEQGNSLFPPVRDLGIETLHGDRVQGSIVEEGEYGHSYGKSWRGR